MTYQADYYQIPTAIDATIAKHILKTVHRFGSDKTKSMVGGLQTGELGEVQRLAITA